jgi:hypothetical protein
MMNMKYIGIGFAFFVLSLILFGYLNARKLKITHETNYLIFVNSCKKINQVSFSGRVRIIEKKLLRSPFHKVHVQLDNYSLNINELKNVRNVDLFLKHDTIIIIDVLREIVEDELLIEEGFIVKKYKGTSKAEVFGKHNQFVGNFDIIRYFEGESCNDTAN